MAYDERCRFLPLVQRPSRYIGLEPNAVVKDKTSIKASFALAFPDIYEVGMSHLGLKILYSILNSIDGVSAERCYAPWLDMESFMRRENFFLTTRETGAPLKNFDVVGFSLQYELSYTNCLNMLELGGIMVESSSRREDEPIVIAGGPCAYNPLPMANFIDAFVIGEAEEAIAEIAAVIIAAKERGFSRRKKLEALSKINGVFVPAEHDMSARIKKRVFNNFILADFPIRHILPTMRTVHDRVVVEIARGCTRGCRFCQAGFVWRPLRERTMGGIKRVAGETLAATGIEEISLLSLSSGDYTYIDELITSLMEELAPRHTALSLPSLRVETLSGAMMESIKKVRKTSFTLAPEAGTQRLREIINKGNTKDDLLNAAVMATQFGWKRLKLYFMLGLPGESETDVEGIADTAQSILEATKKKMRITVSLSSFVPKPHTPFQWCSQNKMEEIAAKQEKLKKLRGRNISVKWHDGRMSFLEGIFSIGGLEAGNLVKNAFLLGCRFDGWTDALRFDLWQEALKNEGFNAEELIKERSKDASFVWDFVDCGVKRGYLRSEYEKSLSGLETKDCRQSVCHDCGACDHKKTKMVYAMRDEEGNASIKNGKTPPSLQSSPPSSMRKNCRYSLSSAASSQKKEEHGGALYRLCFIKTDEARFLSHLEIGSAMMRAMRRETRTLAYSCGFHPQPKISFASATAVGMQSYEEFADVSFTEPLEEPDVIIERINAKLPRGMRIISIKEMAPHATSIAQDITAFEYLALVDDPDMCWDEIIDKLDEFNAAREFEIVCERNGKRVARPAKNLVERMEILPERGAITMRIAHKPSGSIKPVEVMSGVLGIDKITAMSADITKIRTFFFSRDEQ